jgi:glutamine synthetase
MDRNMPRNGGVGKYAIANLRTVRSLPVDQRGHAKAMLDGLAALGVIEWGAVGTEDEFFLVKLKDRHSRPALQAYATSIRDHDPEFAEEVEEMAARAGTQSPFCKEPD